MKFGFETPALFKHYAKVTMQEIMEEKLPLIYSNSIIYDPLVNVDYTETFKRTATGTGENTGNSNSSSNSSASGINIINDTPQTRINKQDINTGAYASNVNQSDTESNINGNTTTSSNTSNESHEEYTRKFKGNQGITASYQKMIEQYRDNIVSIDKDIIKELADLFMGLY